MADIEGKDYRKAVQNGEYGNNRVAIFQATLAAAQIADVVQLGKIPGASRIHTVTLRNAALGASTTLSVGTRYLDSTEGTGSATAFLSAQSTVSAGRNTGANDVVDIAQGKGVEIIGTVGGGAATGAVTVIVEYEYLGQ